MNYLFSSPPTQTENAPSSDPSQPLPSMQLSLVELESDEICLLEQRADELSRLELELEQVNATMRDLHDLVGAQGGELAMAENSLESAENHTADANEHLADANTEAVTGRWLGAGVAATAVAVVCLFGGGTGLLFGALL